MSEAILLLNRAADGWAWAMWALTWQATVLVGVVAILAGALRRVSPGVRYWVWQMVAIKLLVMPVWGVAVFLPAASVSGERKDWEVGRERLIAGVAAEGNGEISVGLESHGRRLGKDGRGAVSGLPRIDWRGWIWIGWVVGIGWQMVAIGRQFGRLRRVLGGGSSCEDPALLSLVSEMAERVGLGSSPAVVMVDGDGSPFVCGVRRPLLVLPRGLADGLEAGALRSVLAHELAHIQRRDLVWDWIGETARVVYWFHPAAHYVAYRARLERELACDQVAMVSTGVAAAGYATTLVEVVSRSSSVAPRLRAAVASARVDGGEI